MLDEPCTRSKRQPPAPGSRSSCSVPGSAATGSLLPSRTAGGYRIYDDGALARLRAMRELVDEGWTPSNAAARGPGRPGGSRCRGHPVARPDRDQGVLARRFVRAAASLDAAAVETVLDEMMATGSFERSGRSAALTRAPRARCRLAARRAGRRGRTCRQPRRASQARGRLPSIRSRRCRHRPRAGRAAIGLAP